MSVFHSEYYFAKVRVLNERPWPFAERRRNRRATAANPDGDPPTNPPSPPAVPVRQPDPVRPSEPMPVTPPLEVPDNPPQDPPSITPSHNRGELTVVPHNQGEIIFLHDLQENARLAA